MRRVLLASLLTATCLVVAACGSQEKSLIDRALHSPIHSATIDAGFTVTNANGKAVDVSLTGPMRSNGADRLESFDLHFGLAIDILGQPKRLAMHLVSTGSNVFIQYAGTTYALGEAKLRRFERQAAREKEPRIRSLADLEKHGVDLESWFPDSSVVGDAQMDGVTVKHLTGRLDVSAALQNIATLIESKQFGRRTRGIVLTPAIIDKIDKAITDPRFDVYVGKDDGAFRRIDATFGLNAPPLTDGKAEFHIDFTGVNKPVTITAPTGPTKPIAELLPAIAGSFLGGSQDSNSSSAAA
jgi:hypothetical protein